MMQADRMQSLLDTIDAPVCDDCLAQRTHTSPTDVAAVCQGLADHGDIDREQGRCTFCGQAKIVSSPIVNRNVG